MDLSWISLYLECRQNLTHLNGWNVESLSIVQKAYVSGK